MSQLVRALRNIYTLFNVKDYGATGKTLSVSDGAITSGTATLTSASGLFSLNDQGKRITIVGAGSAGASLNTTIASYSSSTQVTIAINASTTVSGATVH